MCHCSAAILSGKLAVVVKAPRLVLSLILSILCSLVLLASPAVGQTSTSHPTKNSTRHATKRASAKGTKAKKRKRMSPRVRRVRQAFVASTNLRPMARQLLADRTPAAYAGVEAYARRHAKEDAGSLAYLVLGY